MLLTADPTIAVAIVRTRIKVFEAGAIGAVKKPDSDVLANARSMTAARINDRVTIPTDSIMKLRMRDALDVPNTLYVFTLLILAGTSAKKKLMKLIREMMIISMATIRRDTSVVLFPERHALNLAIMSLR